MHILWQLVCTVMRGVLDTSELSVYASPLHNNAMSTAVLAVK